MTRHPSRTSVMRALSKSRQTYNSREDLLQTQLDVLDLDPSEDREVLGVSEREEDE